MRRMSLIHVTFLVLPVLAVVCLLGPLSGVRGESATFTVEESAIGLTGSAINGDLDPGNDVYVGGGGTNRLRLDGRTIASLGLAAGDDIDAISYGDPQLTVDVRTGDPLGGRDVEGNVIFWHFSVDKYALGTAQSAVATEGLAGTWRDYAPAGPSPAEALGDCFVADIVNMPGVNSLAADEEDLGLSIASGHSMDELNGLDVDAALVLEEGQAFQPGQFFFSLRAGSPSLATYEVHPADILTPDGAGGIRVAKPGDGVLAVDGSHGALGIPGENDLDALFVDGAGMAFFSVVFAIPGVPSANPGDILVPDGTLQAADGKADEFIPAYMLGLQDTEYGGAAEDDNLDALDAALVKCAADAPPLDGMDEHGASVEDAGGLLLDADAIGGYQTDPDGAGADEVLSEEPGAGDGGITPVWVDFAWTGTETGTSEEPFSTLAEALVQVTVGGTIMIKGDTVDSLETPRITKAVRIEVVNGPVTIGRTPSPDPGELVSIPAGSFQMGDPWAEGNSDELPVHTVTLSPYEIGKYEVTNQEYADALNWANGRGYLTTASVYTATGYGQELLDVDDTDCQITWTGSQFVVDARNGYSMADHPVVCVSWYGAAAYCNWLSESEGLTPCYNTSTWECNFAANGYHLPTEAQWERAAAWNGAYHYRYGNGSDSISAATVNYNSNNPLGLSSSPYTVPVGYYAGAPSPVGCYDMSGNVWEWCHDWYESTYYVRSPGTDPTGADSGSARVPRGGGCSNYADGCRSAFRYYYGPGGTSSSLGFRVSRMLRPDSGELVSVSAGSFAMGDPWSEGTSDERPVHAVTLSAYQIGKYEVTNQEYADLLNWANGQGYLTTASSSTATGYGQELLDVDSSYCLISWNGSQFMVNIHDGYSMADHPVLEVSWYGAAAYCNWLSESEGLTPCYDTGTWACNFAANGYHLPTEAQWERAAAWNGSYHYRYGNGSDSISTATVNCDSNNPLGLSGPPYTSPVGHYLGVTSPAGCCDMSGNVWEWCHDFYDYYYYGSSPGTDPTGPASGSGRVGRGGCWSNGASYCRSADRLDYYPEYTDEYVGFRIAR